MEVSKLEIQEAYLQLKRHLYYERLDLNARQAIVEFEDENQFNLENKFNELFEWLKNESLMEKKLEVDSPLAQLIEKITIKLFVKKIDRIDDPNTSNFITDTIQTSDYMMTRENVFVSMPIELQILGTLWLSRIGKKIDNTLSDYCFGNRLLSNPDNNFKSKGRLFKIYHFQYAKWWKLGLSKARSILREDNNDVVMINFDLKSYYHSICLDLNKFENRVNFETLSISNKILHRTLEKVLIKYNEVMRLRGLQVQKPENKYALPIGYIASPIIANDYLNEFDKNVIQNIRPSYYGRYVDDIFVVFKSGTPKSKEARLKDYENYSQLSQIKKQFPESTEAIYRFLKYMGNDFQIVDSDNSSNSDNKDIDKLHFKLKDVEGIELQLQKLFVYELDKDSPSNLIENFIQEQRERSSEFRFESEDSDGVSSEFGEILFDKSFDKEDASKAKIKQLTQNRFEVSVFLSRLIRRSVQSENSPYHDQLSKIIRYYKGANCIENWWLWEKICLALVSNNEHNLLVKFISSVLDSIKKLDFDSRFKNFAVYTLEHQTKNDMKKILSIGLSNALAGNPSILKDKRVKRIIDINELARDYQKTRRAAFIRNEFTAFPLIGLLKGAIDSDISFYSKKSIDQLFSKSELVFDNFFIEYSPVRVKYWQICLIEWLNKLWSLKIEAGYSRLRTFFGEQLELEKVLLPAFEKYFKINYETSENPHDFRKEYFFKYGEQRVKEAEFTREMIEPSAHGIVKKELKIQGQPNAHKLRFGLVNEHVNDDNYKSSAKGNPNCFDRLEINMQILDELQRKNCDVGIQPELSVPHSFISNYCEYSDRHQIALIAGVEHLRIKNVIYNFVMTLLPIKIQDIYHDAIPILRLKNHYAPAEEQMVKSFRATVPKPITYEYHLFNWKGLYFTNYYCYELADINHRTLFQGEIDMLIAPVWNPDTNYYNGVVETSSREIHCVFCQVNTANYGDTRWTKPAKTERKNPITVKGGTTSDHPFTISLAEYYPKDLREFQNLDYNGQKEIGSFKPTPPDFPKEKVEKRIKNEDFYIEE